MNRNYLEADESVRVGMIKAATEVAGWFINDPEAMKDLEPLKKVASDFLIKLFTQ